MPVYQYRCQLCGESADHHVPYAQRLDPLECPACGAQSSAIYEGVQGRPPVTTMSAMRPRRDDGRMIWDERQVEADLGADWRNEGTNRRPGGAGQKLYFHD